MIKAKLGEGQTLDDLTNAITMEIVTDPVELAQAKAQHERFERNWAWLQAHSSEVYSDANRGKIVCVAGQQMFIAETGREAVAQAKAAHPDDDGYFTLIIPRHKGPRIYALPRRLGRL
jgi:hypothetical protein